jgi:hypothetical protein
VISVGFVMTVAFVLSVALCAYWYFREQKVVEEQEVSG